MPGILYLVPNVLSTPGAAVTDLQTALPAEVMLIGAGLEYFIAENAKTARAYLNAINQLVPLARPLQQIKIVELNINTSASQLPELLSPLLAGANAGLISEAGVPAVADPGADLVRLAHEAGIRVKPLVGPSSILLAVMASGLNGQSFAFNGYLPVDAAQRAKKIKLLEQRSRQERQTQLFIETPYRNMALLEALLANCHPDTLICVATNLTLASEEIRTRSASKWKQELQHGYVSAIQKQPTVFLFLAQ